MNFWGKGKKKSEKQDENMITEQTTNPLVDIFTPVPQKLLDILFKYSDKNGALDSMVFGETYLKRLAEMGMLDLDGFCNEMNYLFFVGQTVLTPDLFGSYNVSEIVEIIKEKSVLGGVLT